MKKAGVTLRLQMFLQTLFSAAVEIHNAQLGLFNTLMVVQLGSCQNVAAVGEEVIDILIEGDEVKGGVSLAHDTSGVAAAAGGIAFDDFHIIETEHGTGIAVTER